MFSLSRSALRWGASLALFLPVVVLYLCEYVGGDGKTFTGFIQYDQPYYMANARKFFDGGFHLLYGNPFSPDPHTPAIYFQAHLLVLGTIRAVTGWDPGLVYVIFGFFAGITCVRVAIALYEQIAGLDTPVKWAGLILFLWGGGVLALTGLVFHLVQGSDFHATLNGLFDFDPSQGWWFLNLGRNLVFPTESWYHFLALGAVLMAMRNNFRAALWLAFFLSLSHPFTGLQFLLILLVWSVMESRVMRNKAIPITFPAMLLCLFAFHVAYNLVLLNEFSEHRSIFAQWSLPWTEPASSALPAYVLVGIFTWLAMRNQRLASQLFSSPVNRLLLIWFLVSFILAHHDLVTTPRQPLHFSRGYIWIPLFLLGIQPLLRMLERSFNLQSLFLRTAAVGSIFLIGLSDNLAWFGLHAAAALGPRYGFSWLPDDSFRLGPADRQLYAWLMRRPRPHTELLITPENDLSVAYLAMIYTDYRAWFSHLGLTLFRRQRREELNAFFENGTIPAEWQGRELFVILPKNYLGFRDNLVTPTVYENDGYSVRTFHAP